MQQCYTSRYLNLYIAFVSFLPSRFFAVVLFLINKHPVIQISNFVNIMLFNLISLYTKKIQHLYNNRYFFAYANAPMTRKYFLLSFYFFMLTKFRSIDKWMRIIYYMFTDKGTKLFHINLLCQYARYLPANLTYNLNKLTNIICF